jgi:hypothetical protein
MDRQYRTFREFYPFYLSQHAHPVCRTLHFIGSWVALAMLAAALASGNPWWLAGVPLAGYGFAWVGHFFFEHNRPATFTYPLFSLAGDWVMFYQMLIGRIPFRGTRR